MRLVGSRDAGGQRRRHNWRDRIFGQVTAPGGNSLKRCRACAPSPSKKGPERVGALFCRMRYDVLVHPAAFDALVLTPFRRATVLSLVLAAFFSFRLVVRKRTTSSCPRSSAQAIRFP